MKKKKEQQQSLSCKTFHKLISWAKSFHHQQLLALERESSTCQDTNKVNSVMVASNSLMNHQHMVKVSLDQCYELTWQWILIVICLALRANQRRSLNIIGIKEMQTTRSYRLYTNLKQVKTLKKIWVNYKGKALLSTRNH